MDSQNAMSFNAIDKRQRNTQARASKSGGRPNTDMRRLQKEIRQAAEEQHLIKDTSQVNLNQQAFSEQGRDLPIAGATQHPLRGKNQLIAKQGSLDDPREEDKEMEFDRGSQVQGSSPQQQNVVNILLRNNNDYVDQEHHGGDENDQANNENIQSFTSSNLEQSNGVNNSATDKRGSRKR